MARLITYVVLHREIAPCGAVPAPAASDASVPELGGACLLQAQRTCTTATVFSARDHSLQLRAQSAELAHAWQQHCESTLGQ